MSHRPVWSIVLAGCVAAVLVMASGNLPRASGQAKAPAITPAPQAPTLTTPASLGARKGETVELTLTGTNLNDPLKVVLSCSGAVSIPTENKNGTEPTKLRVKVEIPADCPIGLHTIRVTTRHGVSNFRPFVVDELPVVVSPGNNRTKETALAVPLPAVVTGRVDGEASDFFKVKVAAGQTLTFEVLARRLGSPLDPILLLHDARTLRPLLNLYVDDTPGLQSDCRIMHTFKEAGEFIVEVRDSTYRGGGDYAYRLRMGEFPGVATAYPIAVRRGQTAKVGFAGPNCADVPPVSITAPSDPGIEAGYAIPKRNGSGWPVPVWYSDWPEIVEQEPNDEPAKANKLPVPGGVSAKFDKAHDVDHFAIAGKKGQKLIAAVQTYEINTPTEVLIRVLNSKGSEIARSNPAQASARVEFTPPADGEYVLACEHLNYLFGPNEIYHLTVQPVAADIEVVLALDRCEASPESGTAILATVNRLNGFNGPVELSIVDNPALSGAVTLPAGQTFTFIPLIVKSGTKPGPYPFRVEGKLKSGDKNVVRFGTLIDELKANLGGMSNPPPDRLTDCVAAVVDKPAFSVKLTPEPAGIEKGKAGKIAIAIARDDKFTGDIAIAPLNLPANITATAKPIAKGQTTGEIAVALTPAVPLGPQSLIFRATSKVGGKDYGVILAPVEIKVVEPKKAEVKKDDKKEEPKKKGN